MKNTLLFRDFFRGFIMLLVFALLLNYSDGGYAVAGTTKSKGAGSWDFGSSK